MMKQIILSIITILLLPIAAIAGEISPGCPDVPRDPTYAKEVARDWFAKGDTLIEAKLFDEAVGAFLCSLNMIEHPATLLNIAKAANKSADSNQELKSYTRYLELVPEGEKSDAARVRCAQIKEMIEMEEAAKKIADEETEAKKREKEESAASTEKKPVEVKIAPKKSKNRNSVKAGAVTLVIGSAVLITGLVFQGVSNKAKDDGLATDDHADFLSFKDKKESKQTAAIVSYAVGGVAVLIGALVIASGKKKKRSKKAVSFDVSPTGFTLNGRF